MMRDRNRSAFFLNENKSYRKNVSFDRLAITSFSRAPENSKKNRTTFNEILELPNLRR